MMRRWALVIGGLHMVGVVGLVQLNAINLAWILFAFFISSVLALVVALWLWNLYRERRMSEAGTEMPGLLLSKGAEDVVQALDDLVYDGTLLQTGSGYRLSNQPK